MHSCQRLATLVCLWLLQFRSMPCTMPWIIWPVRVCMELACNTYADVSALTGSVCSCSHMVTHLLSMQLCCPRMRYQSHHCCCRVVCDCCNPHYVQPMQLPQLLPRHRLLVKVLPRPTLLPKPRLMRPRVLLPVQAPLLLLLLVARHL